MHFLSWEYLKPKSISLSLIENFINLYFKNITKLLTVLNYSGLDIQFNFVDELLWLTKIIIKK